MRLLGMIDFLKNEKRIIVDQLIYNRKRNEINKLSFDFIENIGSIKLMFYVFNYDIMIKKERTTKKNTKKSEKVDKLFLAKK
jgi:hypothetical protein